MFTIQLDEILFNCKWLILVLLTIAVIVSFKRTYNKVLQHRNVLKGAKVKNYTALAMIESICIFFVIPPMFHIIITFMFIVGFLLYEYIHLEGTTKSFLRMSVYLFISGFLLKIFIYYMMLLSEVLSK